MKKRKFLLAVIILTIAIGCVNNNHPDPGGGYQFDTGDGNSLYITDSVNKIMISMEVRAYAFDSTFIIVSQQPWDDPSIPDLDEMNSRERDKAFAKSTFRRYWVINKKEKNENVGSVKDGDSDRAVYSNVYGPFTKEEFLVKRKELGVDSLQLREHHR